MKELLQRAAIVQLEFEFENQDRRNITRPPPRRHFLQRQQSTTRPHVHHSYEQRQLNRYRKQAPEIELLSPVQDLISIFLPIVILPYRKLNVQFFLRTTKRFRTLGALKTYSPTTTLPAFNVEYNTHHHQNVLPTSPPNCPGQTHRPPHPRRTESLLRQRAHLPLLAELHRHPRRPRHRHAQLRRPAGVHLLLPVHRRGDGHDDIRPGHVPLEGEEHTSPRPGRVRRPLRPDAVGYRAAAGGGG